MFVCWEDGLAGNKLGNLALLPAGSHFPVASPGDALMTKTEGKYFAVFILKVAGVVLGVEEPILRHDMWVTDV